VFGDKKEDFQGRVFEKIVLWKSLVCRIFQFFSIQWTEDSVSSRRPWWHCHREKCFGLFRENCPMKVSRVQNFSDFFLPMDRGFCVLSTTMVTFCHREECFGPFIQRFWTAPVCGLKNIRHRKKGKNVLALYAHQSVLIMWACETGPRPWYDNIPIPCRRFVFSHRFLTTT
jgi:hypothetical protein